MNTDQASKLQTLRQPTSADDTHYYTLNGVRTDNPSGPGIYICQGRKEVRK